MLHVYLNALEALISFYLFCFSNLGLNGTSKAHIDLKSGENNVNSAGLVKILPIGLGFNMLGNRNNTSTVYNYIQCTQRIIIPLSISSPLSAPTNISPWADIRVSGWYRVIWKRVCIIINYILSNNIQKNKFCLFNNNWIREYEHKYYFNSNSVI